MKRKHICALCVAATSFVFAFSACGGGRALPSDQSCLKYAELAASFSEVQLLHENGKYYAVKPEKTVEVDGQTLFLKIDLGGIGKGWAVDKVNELFDEYGFECGYFNFGKSSIACKKHFKNGGYEMTLTHPRANGTYFEALLFDEVISTSGDYEQYFIQDGVRYCHIIDPTTGKPVQTGVMTATVMGGSAAENDALTTAIIAMGKEKATQFISQKLTDKRALFTCVEDGKYKVKTNISAGQYTILSQDFTAENISVSNYQPIDLPQPYENYTSKNYTYYSMGTTAQLVVAADFKGEENGRKLDEMSAEITQILLQIENSLSARISTSYISKFNAAAAGEKVQIDKTAYEVLSLSLQMHEFTQGFYNPAVYYSTLAYGFQ